MKKSLCLALLFLVSCAGKQYSFNEGPPRLSCKPDNMFAHVGKPWNWNCTFAGDLSKYTNSIIGVEIITKGKEDYPQRSVIGEGLKRIYPYQSVFDQEYYLELTGNIRLGPNDRFAEIIKPNDPTYPQEPIEGIEASLDGSFNLTVRFVEIVSYDPTTGRAEVVIIDAAKLNGKLLCPQCAV